MICPAPFVANETGNCELVLGQGIVDKHGHELDGDNDPKGKDGCDHRDTPEWQAEHRGKARLNVDEHPTKDEAHVEATTTAEVGTPTFDLSKVLPADGAISPLAATLGALAIVSGVVLKLVPAWLRSSTEIASKKLESEIKRLEIEQQARRKDKGGDCAARHAACLASLAEVEARLSALEQKTDGLEQEIAAVKQSASEWSFSGAEGDMDRLEKLEHKVATIATKIGA